MKFRDALVKQFSSGTLNRSSSFPDSHELQRWLSIDQSGTQGGKRVIAPPGNFQKHVQSSINFLTGTTSYHYFHPPSDNFSWLRPASESFITSHV